MLANVCIALPETCTFQPSHNLVQAGYYTPPIIKKIKASYTIHYVQQYYYGTNHVQSKWLIFIYILSHSLTLIIYCLYLTCKP